jgi:hypothetical protein
VYGLANKSARSGSSRHLTGVPLLLSDSAVASTCSLLHAPDQTAPNFQLSFPSSSTHSLHPHSYEASFLCPFVILPTSQLQSASCSELNSLFVNRPAGHGNLCCRSDATVETLLWRVLEHFLANPPPSFANTFFGASRKESIIFASMDGPNGDHAPKRDVKNHLLFEIATEVANRGRLANTQEHLDKTHSSQLVVYTLSSSRKPPSPQRSMVTDILSSVLSTATRYEFHMPRAIREITDVHPGCC